MIKVDLNDSIIDIIGKINSSLEEEVLLDFPFGHPILHNYLSLKIIKSKVINKKITIVTSDIKARKIWKRLGIRFVINQEHREHQKQQRQENLMKHNFSFWEYLYFEIRSFFRKIKDALTHKAIKNIKYTSPYEKIRKSWISLLVLWLMASIWMLLFIFYFAVNKTYIYITPEINIKTEAKNLVFTKLQENVLNEDPNIVNIKELVETINIEDTFKSKQVDYTSTSVSKGKAILINELPMTQTLRPETRLLTSNGILFKTTKWVTIPKAYTDENWKRKFWETEVEIVAKYFDQKWEFIWTKGNLKEATMILPWLKNNRDKIYAVLSQETTWGTDEYSYKIGEKDIEDAKNSMKAKLEREAINKLKSKIISLNKNNNWNYDLLRINDAIKYFDLKIEEIWWVKTWDKIDTFKLRWEISVKAYIYDKDYVYNTLNWALKSNLLKWSEKLMFVDKNSIRISYIIDKEENPTYIKATTEIDYWIAFNYWNKLNARVQKLKTLIKWKSKKEAKKILLNTKDVDKVEIESSPFFVSDVSNIEDNIIIKIDE